MGRIVTTRQGRLEGEEQGGAEVFRGIAFAQPPVGKLRFQAPEPPKRWQGVRAARSFGASAPQIGPVNRLIRMLIGAAGSRQSQDCLYLNVWTPKADAGRRPVMVWLHGGAFILGSGSTPLYSGWRLALRGDVVVVTLNYRLGVLGYASWRSLGGEAGRLPTNLGLRDQIAALEWVRDNIEGFGGDPENVTVFGESAGAMSVGTLLGTPRARGLFHRAILESGAAHNVWSAEEADTVAEQLVRSLGKPSLGLSDLLDMPVTELMRAQAMVAARLGLDQGILAFQPCVDGEVLPAPPLTAIDQGMSAHVPTLAGTNRDEWKLFMAVDPKAYLLSEEELDRRIDRVTAGTEREEDHRAKVVSSYRFVKGSRGGEPWERWAALQSDRIFHYPATRVLEAQSDNGAPVYSYLFEWTPGIVRSRLGSCHGLELPFVFGSLRAPWIRAWLGTGRRAQRLCDCMQDAWLAFARHGRPEHPGLPEWPAYVRGSRSTMALGNECTVRDDPHMRAREFWDPLIRDAQPDWMRRDRGDVREGAAERGTG